MSLKVSELKTMCEMIMKNYGDVEVQCLYITKMGDRMFDYINDCNICTDSNVFALVTDKRVTDKRINSSCLIEPQERKIIKRKDVQKNFKF